MRKGIRILRRGLLFLGLVALLLIADFILLALIIHPWRDMGEAARIGNLGNRLTRTPDGYELDEDARELLGETGAFAMLLGADGRIVWSYALPEELDRTYTIQDVARFTRYYLSDYPVNTWIYEDGLLLVGGRQGSVWKYTLQYETAEIDRILRVIPWLLLGNLAALIFVPMFLQRRVLQRRERERTEWIAGVSHDIRTPLTVILGEAESMQGAERIERQALRIRSLVANLNLSNKLQYGVGDFPMEEVRLDALIREVLADAWNQDESGRLRVEADFPEDGETVLVRGNPDLLRRMLENLVQNSIQHGGEDVEIRVTVRETGRKAGQRTGWRAGGEAGDAGERTVPGTVRRMTLCSRAKSGRRWLVTVSDNGRGASAEQLAALNRKRGSAKLGEHGLGARLVRQIADFHRWSVRFANGEDGGFWCEIRTR